MFPALVAATNIPVTTLADVDVDDADCSLREAIVAANTNTAHHGCAAGTGGNDRILLAVAGTIGLASSLPPITESVAIRGLGAGNSSIDGLDAWAILQFEPAGAEAQFYLVEDLELDDGLSLAGGAISAADPSDTLWLRRVHVLSSSSTFGGGGILAEGDLHLERSFVAFNETTGPAGGGGIHASGTVTVLSSTIFFNSASHANGSGGGIHLQDATALRLVDSTVSGNRAASRGGGLAMFVGASPPPDPIALDCRSSTIIANEADSDLSGGSSEGGGGIALASSPLQSFVAELRNCVVAGNEDPSVPGGQTPDIALFASLPISVTSHGFNLVGDRTGAEGAFPLGTPNANGDFVGEAPSPIDPRLADLADNGGPTPTHAPLQETPHPVVDQGSCVGARADQRGYGLAASGLRVRDIASVPDNPAGDGCDIGAVEAGTVELPAPLLLADGFESGTLLFWSSDLP